MKMPFETYSSKKRDISAEICIQILSLLPPPPLIQMLHYAIINRI